ncbi:MULTISPECIES: BTAD domain-containing putative transcriptional regulator [unclassified Sinorhizobium]|uniref:BTAD domain-containing putative transcriptional regulator n=1 Tax=unclassified Sinorhizobium TaxID=2613772 RepID=UPI0024C34409|nr:MULTISPECIES: BTAD domain-containing putative transcriptional regulator [unclassified Sinorhizobium]MDK1373269.1 BTAD domain-containing putative transcriptional regulator [Sinorhizobium sp. 6-70]MDK1479131.1 BTAD domain-containing putative transcriptional regulator [Sinorhizobium sp. 6-117]
MRIRLLGELTVVSPSDEPVRFTTRKTALVFAALVLAGRRGVRRGLLADGFWPGRGEAQARNSLRQTLVDIRRAFPEGNSAAIEIEADLETVSLAAGSGEADLWVFDHLIEEGGMGNLAAAAGLYRGDLLSEISIPDELEQWFQPHRSNYWQKALQLVDRLSRDLGANGDTAGVQACERLAEQLLASEPAAEEAHRAMIRIYQHRGQANAAMRQYLLCREALQRELGVEPEAATRALIETPPEAPPQASPGAAVKNDTPAAVPREREQPSVVVMPFDNLSSEEDDYFVDGVVEEITAALSRVRDFFVIARQSAFTYKGRFIDVREVGAELGVSYVVEGTVRRGGDRLRISVQLVDAESRKQLWSDRYEGVSADLFEFQDRIAAQVAGAIHPAVRHAEIESATCKPPANLRAYDLVMRAFPKLWGQNAVAIAEAMKTLQQALQLDPKYGRAHALLAWCHALNITYLWSPDQAAELQATLDAVDRASGLIEDDPTALTACGAAASLSGDQQRAAAFIESALALDPNNAWAWTRYGWVGIYQDEAADAQERFERAIRLSPLDPFLFNMRMGLGAAYALAGRFSESVAIARDVVTRNPNVTWAYRQLAAWAAMNDDMKTARWAAERFLAIQPDYTIAKYIALPSLRDVSRFRETMAAGMKKAGMPEN